MRFTFSLLFVASISFAAERRPVNYTREVRPILANSCYACHGPDDKQRKAKLRLDVRAEAIKKAIVPGKASASPLIERVTSKDSDEVMPPAHAKKPAITPAKAAIFEPLDRRGGQVRSALGVRQAGARSDSIGQEQGLGAKSD